MPKAKKPSSDFEDRFFDELSKRLDKQDATLDKIHDQVRYTNGKVINLRSDVDDLQAKINVKVIPWYADKSLLYIALLCLFGFFSIIAAFLGVRIPTP